MKCRTLEELEAIPGEILTCENVAGVLQVKPYNLCLQARQYPETIPFPVIVMGTRVKIPKKPFLKFMRGENEDLRN